MIYNKAASLICGIQNGTWVVQVFRSVCHQTGVWVVSPLTGHALPLPFSLPKIFPTPAFHSPPVVTFGKNFP